MLNSDYFASRLNKILEYHQLSASAFADSMGIGRSSISHILSGRNKPSLDFVMKVVENYPEVDLYWLVKGEGSFPKEKKEEKKTVPKDLFDSNPDVYEKEPAALPKQTAANNTKKVQKLILLYEDGTFEVFQG